MTLFLLIAAVMLIFLLAVGIGKLLKRSIPWVDAEEMRRYFDWE
jgi:hypothetical protein